MGANMQYLDVGGGLGVDYDGSRSDTSSSIDMTIMIMLIPFSPTYKDL